MNKIRLITISLLLGLGLHQATASAFFATTIATITGWCGKGASAEAVAKTPEVTQVIAQVAQNATEATQAVVAPAVQMAILKVAEKTSGWSIAGENLMAIGSNLGKALVNCAGYLWILTKKYSPKIAAHATEEFKGISEGLIKAPVVTAIGVVCTAYCAYKIYNYFTTPENNQVQNQNHQQLRQNQIR